jgi:hypothetical protein
MAVILDRPPADNCMVPSAVPLDQLAAGFSFPRWPLHDSRKAAWCAFGPRALMCLSIGAAAGFASAARLVRLSGDL